MPGFEAIAWHGLVAPTGTPAAVIETLAREVQAFMRTDATKQKFAELGAVAVSLGPQDFAAYIASETQRWSRVVEAANIRLE